MQKSIRLQYRHALRASLIGFTLAAAAPFALHAQTTPAAPAKPAAPVSEDSVLGKVGDIQVTVGEFRGILSNLGVKDGSIANVDSAALNQALRTLLVQRILLQEAKDAGWDQQAAVKVQLERVKDAAITETYLQSKAAPPETYPSEAELQAAYDANKGALLVPKTFRVAQIFVASPKGAAKDVEDKATAKVAEVRKALAAGEDFAKVASANSQEVESAGRGGEIGWLQEAQVQPGIRDVLTKLKLNAVSEAVKLDDGYHFVKVLDIREPFTPTLDQVKVQLRARMRQEKTKANSEAYLAQLLKDNPLAINELALSQVLPESAKK
jgi:parvulin-like peptidyl-prolyl isomerase